VSASRPRHPTVPGWLRTPWALHPSACKVCGLRKQVHWASSSEGEHWYLCCQDCDVGKSIPCDARVSEARVFLTSQTDRPDLPEAPPLSVWVRDGCTLDASQVMRVGQAFLDLAKARLFKSRNPAPWALELRPDGRVWAPWDPAAGGPTWRLGSPLPLRSKTLRASRRHRACRACKTGLGDGQTAWCPDGRRNDWSSAGLRLLWCPSCVTAVTVAGQDSTEPQSGEMIRHLRVFEGGT
jgi:hypothetical protein